MNPADVLPLIDGFDIDQRSGQVIGTRTASGHRRFGSDVEGVLSIDHDGLRIKPLVRPDWGRSAIAYGPFKPGDGLAASVVLTNGRNGSEDLEAWPTPVHWLAQHVRGTQSDSPLARSLKSATFRGRDGLARRLRTARHDAEKGEGSRSAANLAFGWSSSATMANPERGPGLVVTATGADNARLCVAGSVGLEPVAELAELPMRLILSVRGDELHFSWSVDDGGATWPEPVPLGTAPFDQRTPGWFVLQQRVLGQVGWGIDTRVREVRIDRGDPGCGTTSALRPSDGSVAINDRFVIEDRFETEEAGPGVELDGRPVDGTRWRKVSDGRSIVVGAGAATVEPLRPVRRDLASRLLRPSGQRTMYTVEWDGSPGAIETEITPPGSGRGQAEGGRGGLVLWADADNFLIVNDWLDDAYPGASVSAFRRVDGFEEVYDAVWVNVADRILWGRPHRLAIGFDRLGFTAYLDGSPVLHREFADVYPNHPTLDVRAVGICANWEFGDDTGSRFSWFTARRR